MRHPSAVAFVAVALLAAGPSRSEIGELPGAGRQAAAPILEAVGRLRAGTYLEPDHRTVSSLLAGLKETPELSLLAAKAAREEDLFWRKKPLESPGALIRALEEIVGAFASPTMSGKSANGSPQVDLRSLHLPNFDGSGAAGPPPLALVDASPAISRVIHAPKEAAIPAKRRLLVDEPIRVDARRSSVGFVGRGVIGAAGEALTALGNGSVDLAAAAMAVGLAGVTSGALREGFLERAKVNFYDNALSAKLGESWGGALYAQGKADLRLDRTKHVQNVGSEMKGLGKPITGAVLQGGVGFADNLVPLLANIEALRLVSHIGAIGRMAVAAASVKWSWQGGWRFGSAVEEFGRAAAGYDEKVPASLERLYASVENATEQSLNLPLLLGGLRSLFGKRAPTPPKESVAWKPGIVPDRGYARMLDLASQTLDGAAPRPNTAGRGDALLSMTAKTAPATHAHMVRVGLMSGLIALRMGFSMNAAQEVNRAARMHDVGKLDGSIQELVVKRGPLTAGERSLMQQHPDRGALMIADSPGERSSGLRHARRAALSHHEAWDGRGYPKGLRGTQIPMEARITTVADVYDALMENRPYHKALTSDQALDIMSGQKERFDPVVWKNFLDVLRGPASGDPRGP